MSKIDIKDIERSIIKKYRKEIWGKFTRALKEYMLINEGDKVAVAISGGKDSLLLAKLLQEIQRHGKEKFEIEFISMDPGFNKENRKLLEDNCKRLNIPVKIRESHIFDIVDEISKDQPCYLCARMRRGFLYNFAQELGCNKLALGHHFNDVIETTMLNTFYAYEFKTMLPKVKSENYRNMELIRPLYLVKEESIIRWKNYIEMDFMDCGCTVGCKVLGSKRKEIKNFISKYKKVNPNIDKSIFEAACNVNLDSIVGFRKNGVKRSYLEEKDEN
ncbi:tRNA 2-thiocytidine biosynthesis protein TtcA [Mycoplasmatota bacterium]|nr:tRNA 2-thiocytidine biosynthesis protein TtcA [Mycoplasmatota bacterium]